jgi:predicted transposase/invertase (TIGR01784 family)
MEKNKTEVVQRYVNLLTNSGFKAVFGDRNNKDVVMSVINMLLPEGKHVEEIEYAPTEHQGQQENNKEFRYDFMCHDADGSFFIVEVQSNPEEFWFKRCVSYASRVYDRQNRRGGEYDVPPVYLIGLMGIDVKHKDPELWRNRFVSEYSFREKLTNELQDDTIFIIFAELRRFAKQLHECENDLEKMLYIIKNGWRLANQPQELQDEIFTRLFNACDIPRFDEVKRIQYDKDMFDERRYNGEIAAARAEGRNEGREEGRVEGEKFMSHQIAKNMLSMSIDVETIVKATGLTIKEIESL